MKGPARRSRRAPPKKRRLSRANRDPPNLPEPRLTATSHPRGPRLPRPNRPRGLLSPPSRTPGSRDPRVRPGPRAGSSTTPPTLPVWPSAPALFGARRALHLVPGVLNPVQFSRGGAFPAAPDPGMGAHRATRALEPLDPSAAPRWTRSPVPEDPSLPRHQDVPAAPEIPLPDQADPDATRQYGLQSSPPAEQRTSYSMPGSTPPAYPGWESDSEPSISESSNGPEAPLAGSRPSRYDPPTASEGFSSVPPRSEEVPPRFSPSEVPRGVAADAGRPVRHVRAGHTGGAFRRRFPRRGSPRGRRPCWGCPRGSPGGELPGRAHAGQVHDEGSQGSEPHRGGAHAGGSQGARE